MAVSQTDIDVLNAAIAQGERVVRLNNKTIEYRSVAELIVARNDLQAQVNQANHSAPPTKHYRLYHGGRGY